MKSILEIKNLNYHYKSNVPVLQGIDCSFEAGKCICLLGKNGAGKTTLFKCILGLLKDYSGKINVCGENIKNFSVRKLAEKVAYIPQAHEPMFNYTVFETVLMGTNAQTNYFRTPGKSEYEITEKMIEMLNITHFAQRGYAEISGGERQLTLIARALAQKSKILVMDEPTANLDYGNQIRVMQRIKELSQKGYLIITSTHNPEHALLYADSVIALKNGKTLVCGKPEDVLNAKIMKELYNVSVEYKKINSKWGETSVFLPNVG